VAVSEFVFVVHLSGHDEFDTVLGELAMTVLQQVGCAPDAAAELVEQLKAAVTPSLARGEGLDVQFHAHPGSCDVVAAAGHRELWRMTRRAR
jgi:hypothetical protein